MLLPLLCMCAHDAAESADVMLRHEGKITAPCRARLRINHGHSPSSVTNLVAALLLHHAELELSRTSESNELQLSTQYVRRPMAVGDDMPSDCNSQSETDSTTASVCRCLRLTADGPWVQLIYAGAGSAYSSKSGMIPAQHSHAS